MKSLTKKRLLFMTVVLTGLWVPADASVLSGSSVSGELYFGSDLSHNAFDQANGACFGITPVATISNSTAEFCYFLAAFVSVDFSDIHPQLTVVYNTAPFGIIPGIIIRLTDTAFHGLSLVPLTDSFRNGLNSVLAGDQITLTWPGTVVTDDLPGCVTCHTATFDFTSVPEPSAWVTAGVGILGLLLASRCRRSPSVSWI